MMAHARVAGQHPFVQQIPTMQAREAAAAAARRQATRRFLQSAGR